MGKYKVLCIEGTKGAGKSTTLETIQSSLEATGYFVSVCRPFAEATDFFRQRCGYENATAYSLSQVDEEHAIMADEVLKNIVINHHDAFVKSIGKNENIDKSIMLMDRGWMTARCSLDDSCLSENARENRWIWWANNIPPTVFIHTKPDVTKRRRDGELNYESGLSKPELVQFDYSRRLFLREKYSSCILASHETVEISCEIQKSADLKKIANDVLGSFLKHFV